MIMMSLLCVFGISIAYLKGVPLTMPPISSNTREGKNVPK